MAAILENGAVYELHTHLTMSSRSFVTPTPQRLILDMQTNVVIRLPPTRKLEPFLASAAALVEMVAKNKSTSNKLNY